MKIGLYQFDVVQHAPQDNLRRILEGTTALDVELLVLPELCTSGYLLSRQDALRHAIALSSDDIAPFVRIARRLDAWVVAAVVERDAQRLYNTSVLVGPRGLVGSQRKVHLTALEHRVFTAGTEFQTFTLGELRLGVVTCFDAWFPEACRQLVRDGAQLLCQPAAFGSKRTLQVMKVRSMENHVFSVTANRLGEEQMGDVHAHFRGESQIVDCDGEILAQAGDEPTALVADLDVTQADAKTNVMCEDLSAEWSRYYARSSPLQARTRQTK